MTNYNSLRLDALRQIGALVDETSRFTNQQFAERRIVQCHIIIKCIDEQETAIHRLQAEVQSFIDNYLELKELMQRMVHLCESYGINFMTICDDQHLTAEKLAKIRAVFPKEKLDALSDRVFDWLQTDDIIEDYEKNPCSFNADRLEQFTKQLEQKYGKAEPEN